ncbi:hypothetical protein CS0771_52140 [Catellatospora sp. IY07-71]|uniref:class I SAM-dependent methyltransferase n=1 Tax=Catellatospora sp. IY07-71 TaxID=2728827 RepID=UPI001BB37B57|nr:class I SAM-dependent methyltransferase [Catellatospora sp. IY07-71]BCJ75670.1 hypothetical protein CS0771_52140 [Catellatospora sp. IY07-71]
MEYRYADVLAPLRRAYDAGAEERDTHAKEPWKLAERAAFEARLRAEGRRSLLELGAGTGQDSLYFVQQGYTVVAIDLSPEMVRRCRAKGVDARVADFLNPGAADESVDAVYALNSLLHVPDADLPAVLAKVRAVLRPGGLFFLGVWGGRQHAGPLPTDAHEPPRFFAWRTDDELLAHVRPLFDVVDFHVVAPGGRTFQSLTLRRPPWSADGLSSDADPSLS